MRALYDATTLATLPILAGPSYVLVPIGYFALTLLMVRDLPRVATGTTLLFATEEPPQ